MAYYVAKVLKKRPNDILENWSSPELCVAYGIYANQERKIEYEKRKSINKTAKEKVPMVNEYAVRFFTREDLESEEVDGD